MTRNYEWVQKPSTIKETEKLQIIAACETLIRDFLKPRFLPKIEPTQFNYAVDIRGAWAGGRYRFIQRYRSGHEDNLGEEFDAPFARLHRVGRDRFDIYWMRHTGKWWRLHTGVTFAEALHLLKVDALLHPI